MREVLKREGAPEDLFQVIEKPSIPAANERRPRLSRTLSSIAR
jgi:hypothetical protein